MTPEIEQQQEETDRALLLTFNRLAAIREAMGYIQNGSGETLKIYQDDATGDFHIVVGKHGAGAVSETFEGVLDALVQYNKENPKV